MRLGKFESAGIQPLGEGDEKRVFVNPENENRVISESKEESEKETPRQLKGRYYLSKITHLLLPHNIPDVYQAGESVDGQQTVDAERIAHTPGHTLLQKQRLTGGDETKVAIQIESEMGEGIGELSLELERIGLGFIIDDNFGNFSKDNDGNVVYLETFKPWETDPTNPEHYELLFDKETLEKAIESIKDDSVKEKCKKYLERLLILFEEDNKKLKETLNSSTLENSEVLKELDALYAPFVTEEILTTLHTIATEEEAMNSEERKAAMIALKKIFKKINSLVSQDNVSNELRSELWEKFKILANATGTINKGLVDHNR